MAGVGHDKGDLAGRRPECETSTLPGPSIACTEFVRRLITTCFSSSVLTTEGERPPARRVEIRMRPSRAREWPTSRTTSSHHPVHVAARRSA